MKSSIRFFIEKENGERAVHPLSKDSVIVHEITGSTISSVIMAFADSVETDSHGILSAMNDNGVFEFDGESYRLKVEEVKPRKLKKKEKSELIDLVATACGCD